jgi:hypothetical protein
MEFDAVAQQVVHGGQHRVGDRKDGLLGAADSDAEKSPPSLRPSLSLRLKRSKLAGTIRGSFFVTKGEY